MVLYSPVADLVLRKAQPHYENLVSVLLRHRLAPEQLQRFNAIV